MTKPSYYHTHFEKILDESSGTQQQYLHYLKIIKQYNKKCNSWLDIGCSRGDFLNTAKTEFNFVKGFGIDIDNDSIKEAKNRHGRLGLSFEQHDVNLFLHKSEQQFDIITCLNVLEHLDTKSIVKFLESLKKILSKNGIFFFKIPNAGTNYNNRWLYDDITHKSYLTNRSVKQLFSIANCNLDNLKILEDSSLYLSKIGKLRFLSNKIYQLQSIFTHGLSHKKDPQTPTIIGLYFHEPNIL